MIRAGILGFGFMGRTHLAAYRDAAEAGLPVRITRVCDPSFAQTNAQAQPQAAGGNLPSAGDTGLAGVSTMTDPEAMINDPDLDVLSICTYTDTHVDYAIKALRAGKHVLVEKPLALKASRVEELAQAAAGSSRLCMPAMCMRFWPGWDWLQRAIVTRAYGEVRSAVFQRVGAGPSWASEFYRDPARSGGALVDLHIHDVDFITWCFGTPTSVASTGSVDHVTTAYRFASGPLHVTAEGGWSVQATAGFRMRYCVCFDKATADFDISRPAPLLLHEAGGTTPVKLGKGSGYSGEIAHFIGAIASGRGPLRATLPEAVVVARILEAEQESLRRAAPITIPAKA